MPVLEEAISLYNSGEYIQAREKFIEAGKLYGASLVTTNIELCNEHINSSRSGRTNNGRQHLDVATKLMLANAGAITLSSNERRTLLEQYSELTKGRSEDTNSKQVNPIPPDWPKNLTLNPLPESTNDFEWLRHRNCAPQPVRCEDTGTKIQGLSIIIPTFNRARILDITLACLTNQVTSYPFEVIVADDGSHEDLLPLIMHYESKLDIRFVRQPDEGYQLCRVRNLGIRAARYQFLSILDCDMAPGPRWVQSYMERLSENDNVALIGTRKYVDTSEYTGADFIKNPELLESLPETITNNEVAGKVVSNRSVDWRLEHFKKTDMLRLCDTPFRYFSGGNVAFSKKWIELAGWFDEEFTDWGGEDNEFAYRLYRAGCFFRALEGGVAYHQEPPGKENETDRAQGKKVTINMVRDKVPYFYRKLEPISSARMHRIPLVSIYIPAYNCEKSIVRCIDSALNQTIVDLEVCVCNDGSTDSTLEIIQSKYLNNPRVRIIDQENGGIASASNSAVRACQGYYIGQLDSDDYLEPDAVEICLREFFNDRRLVCVYTTNRNVDQDGSFIENGYNWPQYSREKLTTAMIVHHFRMFTIRAWNLSGGFDETLVNAVDYDMFLKLSEIGPFKHVNKISYNRVLHGNNTSIKKLGIQKKNHFYAVNQSLKRQGINNLVYSPKNPDDEKCRQYTFIKHPDW